MVHTIVPHCFLELLAHRALDPPPSSSLAEERTPPLASPPHSSPLGLVLATLAHLVGVRRRAIPDARSWFRAAHASRFGSAAVVVARRGKNASARFSSVRRRAIPDARS